jgi:hypothetical protein
MSKTSQNRIIVAIGLACVVVYAPALLASARRCEATGGVWTRSLLDGGLVCVKKRGVIPLEGDKMTDHTVTFRVTAAQAAALLEVMRRINPMDVPQLLNDPNKRELFRTGGSQLRVALRDVVEPGWRDEPDAP